MTGVTLWCDGVAVVINLFGCVYVVGTGVLFVSEDIIFVMTCLGWLCL